MYKIKDNVIYNSHKCFIGQVLGGGRYTVISHNKDFVIEVYEKDLEPIDNDIPPTCDRHEVRHVVYDTKDNKIVNDAMGECYITLAEAQEVCDEMNAPKVMKPKYTKEVEYFGMKVLVPDDTKWLSATDSGDVIAHTCIIKPDEINSCGFYSGTGIYKDHHVSGGVDLNGIDWKDTLVEIK